LDAYAKGAAEAALVRAPGVAAAVFPVGPERSVYNNALLSTPMAEGVCRAGDQRGHGRVRPEADYLRARRRAAPGDY
jgi:hypothetical protein